MPSEYLERELKFEVRDPFVAPALADLLGDGGRLEAGSTTLESQYFDTPELDLLHRGITLRRRTGGENGWQLKVPGDGARTEISSDHDADASAVPIDLAHLAQGAARGQVLKAIVKITTERVTQRLLNADGGLIAEMAIDHVRAAAPEAGAVRVEEWREVEAELGPFGDERTLRRIAKKLARSGATAAGYPNKVARALRVSERGDQVRRSKRTTAGDVIGAYLRQQDEALVSGDLELRRGRDVIHPTRVATRRMRSALRVFADFVDADRARRFDSELAWYAEVLGQVRDLEVQQKRLLKSVAELPPHLVVGPVAEYIEKELTAEHAARRAALAEAMRSDRYLDLLRESARWAADPPLTAAAGKKPDTLRRAVAAAEKKVDRHLSAGLAAVDDDEELHKARKAAKRARYAAELTREVLGAKAATSTVKRYQGFQDLLGEHQDSVVAGELLLHLAAAASSAHQNSFTYGVLFEWERLTAQRTRREARAKVPAKALKATKGKR